MKIFKGKVIQISGDKTVKVQISRKQKHKKYGKILNKYTNLLVHDEKNIAKVNDSVVVQETKPISKTKSYIINKIVE